MSALGQKILAAFLILIGLSIGIFGLLYYLSPVTRLELYGTRLDHKVALARPTNYLWGWQAHVKSWTERDGQMDTPLADETMEEVSTFRIDRQPGTMTQNVLVVKPQEWISSLESAGDFKNQTIPSTHPSIAPGRIILDKQGTLLERSAGAAWRTARALQFLFPRFPKGFLRRGNTWTEPLEWTETINDWTLGWKGDLRWSVKDFETLNDQPCARLVYEAALSPSLLKEVFWAKGSSRDVQYSGKNHGEAIFNVQEKSMVSNTFAYEGTLKIHIPNLENVPEALRVGAPITHSEGDVVLQVNDKMDLRLP